MIDEDLKRRITDKLASVGGGKPRRAGGENMMIRCPFHEDNSPSFCMNVSNGLFICYGCGVEGNFRTFLSKLGMSPQDIRHQYGVTLQRLADTKLPERDLARPKVVMPSNRHIDEDLLGLFDGVPEKLLKEGFSEKILREFGIGLDKHHNRITFPLRDIEGNLVGISGRALNINQEPRYKVYQEEYKVWDLPPYNTDKGNLLWNGHTLFQPLQFMNGRPQVVLVEGFKAAMWVRQAGVPFVAAFMTKRMSAAQKWILERMGGEYILMLDNDAAGIDGTINVSRQLNKGTVVRIVEYDGLQPTDVPLELIPELIARSCSYNSIMLG